MTRRLFPVAVLVLVSVLFFTSTNVGTHTSERPSVSPDAYPGGNAGTSPEPTHQLPERCIDPLPLPTILATSLSWSPDGGALAVAMTETGRARVAVLRAPTWGSAVTIDGSDPRWSASSSRIAVTRGANVVVVDAANGRELGMLTPAAHGYGWSAETLLYWDGSRLRGWTDRGTVAVGAHQPDVTPLTGALTLSVSADGSRYALQSSSVVMFGDTRDGRLGVLPRAGAISWASFGSNALVTFPTGERAFLSKLIFGARALPSAFVTWSPDGTQALFGDTPTGAAWDLIGWAGTKNGDTTSVARGLAEASFAPTGAYLGGTIDGALRIDRCGGSTGSAAVITRGRAKQIVDQTGELLRVNLSDSKLVRWGDIAGMLTGDWAVRDAAAGQIAPTDPVWVLMYAGEAKRPDGVHWDQPTVNLILYVLDARDGSRLARRIANGTWWIGEPFDGLKDRAPDATSHPFEPPPSATNPIQMPVPPPTPTLATRVTAPGLARAESAAGGWSLDYPDGWWPSRDGFAGATLSTRDPSAGRGGGVALPGEYEWAASMNLELWGNPERLTPDAFADRRFPQTSFAEKWVSRTPTTVAGRAATTITVRAGPNPPDNSFTMKRYWIVPTARDDRLVVISASPADSVYAPEFDRVVASLTLTTPRPTTTRPDVTKQQVLDRWTSMKTPPARVEAKLVTFAEASAADTSASVNPLRRDPDGLVWIVAISDPTGSLIPTRGGPAGPSRAAHWQVYVAPAYSDDPGDGLWGQAGFDGDWPPFFDALRDRCC